MISPLELARMLFGPAFHYDFFVGVELDGVAALAVEVAEEAVLPSAEGEVGHGRGDSDVDADIAGGRFVAEFAGGGATSGEERGLISVGALANELDGFVNRVSVNQAEYRSENFRVGQRTRGRHAVKDGGLEEISVFVIGELGVAAVEQPQSQ